MSQTNFDLWEKRGEKVLLYNQPELLQENTHINYCTECCSGIAFDRIFRDKLHSLRNWKLANVDWSDGWLRN